MGRRRPRWSRASTRRRERCALYSPDGASYTVGVETFEGGLEPLLLVEGSTIELLAGTENLECQTPSS